MNVVAEKPVISLTDEQLAWLAEFLGGSGLRKSTFWLLWGVPGIRGSVYIGSDADLATTLLARAQETGYGVDIRCRNGRWAVEVGVGEASDKSLPHAVCHAVIRLPTHAPAAELASQTAGAAS
jgi:hypothetical protein